MQWNVNVPAVLNVRDIEVLALLPRMSAGGLVPVSNFTVWATVPKTKVTVPPGAIVTEFGEKASCAVAPTVASCGEGPGGAVVVLPLDPDDPHATSAAESSTVPSVRCPGRIVGTSYWKDEVSHMDICPADMYVTTQLRGSALSAR
jgi:hypothetical protein